MATTPSTRGRYGNGGSSDSSLTKPSRQGTPRAFQLEDSGLLDIALDPRFAENHLVYLSFAEGDSSANHTALFRARLEENRFTDGRIIFRASPDKVGAGHPDSRIVFLPDETLLLSIGEGFDYRDQAQQLGSLLGKLVRLDREGRPPADNPFVDSAGARPVIYSYGESPVLVWVPSIAPSGLALYLRDGFPERTGDFLVGGLAERSLRRIRIRLDSAAPAPEIASAI